MRGTTRCSAAPPAFRLSVSHTDTYHHPTILNTHSAPLLQRTTRREYNQSQTKQAETRRALAEQLELGQQLRKKAGLDGSEGEESEEVCMLCGDEIVY